MCSLVGRSKAEISLWRCQRRGGIMHRMEFSPLLTISPLILLLLSMNQLGRPSDRPEPTLTHSFSVFVGGGGGGNRSRGAGKGKHHRDGSTGLSLCRVYAGEYGRCWYCPSILWRTVCSSDEDDESSVEQKCFIPGELLQLCPSTMKAQSR